MFVIVQNDNVILGPMKWNRFRFQNVIEEDCEITVTLPNRNPNCEPIIVNEEIKILPVQDIGSDRPFNPKIEFAYGPFWTFTETHAISSYTVLSKSIDQVKYELKSQAASERWRKEISGIKVTVQDNEITVDTNRGERDIFVQKYLLMNENDTVMWKFPELWLNLTKSNLGFIVSSGATHVQQAFEWEATMIAQIDSCTTLEQLDSIIIVEPPQPIPNPIEL